MTISVVLIVIIIMSLINGIDDSNQGMRTDRRNRQCYNRSGNAPADDNDNINGNEVMMVIMIYQKYIV